MKYLRSDEKRLLPISHLKDERLNNAYTKMFNSSELNDFVNWHLKVCKINERHELENLELIASFLDGDKPEEWHRKLETTKITKPSKNNNTLGIADVSDCFSFAKYLNDWYEYSDNTNKGNVYKNVVTGRLMTEQQILNEWFKLNNR